VKSEQGNRPQLPSGPQQIQRRWVWLGYHLASCGRKPIGDTFLGRINNYLSLVGRGSVPIANIAGGTPICTRVLEDGAANFYNSDRTISR
jgi:hypothetical protein